MGKRRLILTLIGVVMVFGLFGCSKKYNVDYCGQKDAYMDAKDQYRAGQKVELCFELIATDTDYTFYLDGESINFLYDDSKGYILSFTMPDHDIKLWCETKNSSICEPALAEHYVEVNIKSNPTTGFQWQSSQEPVLMDVREDYTADSQEEGLCGGGGVQTMEFIPFKAGTVSITFKYCRSWEEIDDTVSFTSVFEIDEDLQIHLVDEDISEEIMNGYAPEIVIY